MSEYGKERRVKDVSGISVPCLFSFLSTIPNPLSPTTHASHPNALILKTIQIHISLGSTPFFEFIPHNYKENTTSEIRLHPIHRKWDV